MCRNYLVGAFSPDEGQSYIPELARKNQEGEVKLDFDLTDSLTADTVRLLSESCRLEKLVATGACTINRPLITMHD